jgi:tetratricopeptide (TPR) repeat protein
VLDSLGDRRGALEDFRFCLDLMKKKALETPSDVQVRGAEAYYAFKVAAQSEKVGDKTEALRLAREALRLRERLSAEDSSGDASKLTHAELFENCADLLARLGQTNEARQIYQKALQIYTEISTAAAENAELNDRKKRIQQKINVRSSKTKVYLSQPPRKRISNTSSAPVRI